MLYSMGLQRVIHNQGTELYGTKELLFYLHEFYVKFPKFGDMISSQRSGAKTYDLSVPVMNTPSTFSV